MGTSRTALPVKVPFAYSSSGIMTESFSARASTVSASVMSPGTSSLVATQTLASGSHSALTVICFIPICGKSRLITSHCQTPDSAADHTTVFKRVVLLRTLRNPVAYPASKANSGLWVTSKRLPTPFLLPLTVRLELVLVLGTLIQLPTMCIVRLSSVFSPVLSITPVG